MCSKCKCQIRTPTQPSRHDTSTGEVKIAGVDAKQVDTKRLAELLKNVRKTALVETSDDELHAPLFNRRHANTGVWIGSLPLRYIPPKVLRKRVKSIVGFDVKSIQFGGTNSAFATYPNVDMALQATERLNNMVYEAGVFLRSHIAIRGSSVYRETMKRMKKLQAKCKSTFNEKDLERIENKARAITIYGLKPIDIDISWLYDVFTMCYGPVDRVTISRNDKTKWRSGMAYVCFSQQETVERVLESYENGTHLFSSTAPIFSSAISRNFKRIKKSSRGSQNKRDKNAILCGMLQQDGRPSKLMHEIVYSKPIYAPPKATYE